MPDDVNNVYFDEGSKKTQYADQKKKVEFTPTNYLNTRLEKNEKSRKTKIRIILTKDIDGRYKMAIPVEVHSLKLSESQNRMKKVSESGFKSFICLNDSHVVTEDHKGCPLCDKMREIFAEANTITDKLEKKAVCKKAFSYDTKIAYIVRCIERGKEDEGVKFWRFNKRDDGTGIFDELKAMYMTYRYPTDENGEDYMLYDNEGNPYVNEKYTMPADGEWEDIFDYENGRDINIVLSQSLNKADGAPEKTGVKLMVDPKRSPLSQDKEQAEAWINDEKDWRDMYRVKSYDYLKILADEKTPVFNRDLGKFVPFADSELELDPTDLRYDGTDDMSDENAEGLPN